MFLADLEHLIESRGELAGPDFSSALRRVWRAAQTTDRLRLEGSVGTWGSGEGGRCLRTGEYFCFFTNIFAKPVDIVLLAGFNVKNETG